MKENAGATQVFMKDRTFLLAVLISILWHAFWFFSVTIVVTSPKKAKPRPAMVSLGPVLDDSFFKTLLQTRPQFSETIYRQPADFSAALESKVQKLERQEAGAVVSMPFGKNFIDAMKGAVGGEKTVPEEIFPFFHSMTANDGIEGDAAARQVLSRPVEPKKRPASSLKHPRIEVEFSVLPDGGVAQASVLVSSGNARADLEWIEYLKQWRFEPLPGKTGAEARGKIVFDASEES